MIRNLKALGLALVAVFAMGAVVAANASAASFHSEAENTIVTGEGTNHVFKSGSLEITCKKATFAGTSVKTGGVAGDYTTTELTVHPTYHECSDNIFGGSDTVDTTGCNYVFHSETNASKDLTTDIECTTGFAIKVTAAGCTLSFGAQITGGGVTVANEGSGSSRDTKATATSTATFTKSGISCGLVSGTSGTYTGTTTMKGFVDNGVSGPIDEVEGGVDKTAVYTEGAQVGIWWQ